MEKEVSMPIGLRRKLSAVDYVLAFFLAFCSIPRILLEVFIRKNFGERYLRLSAVIIIAFLMALWPLFVIGTYSAIAYATKSKQATALAGWTAFNYISWYVFLFAFVGISIYHWRKLKRSRSKFDFSKYSLYAGDIHPLFSTIQINGKAPSTRLIECVLEPALFFLLGLSLWFMQQSIGTVLIICSIFYSLSYFAAYRQGDDFVLDKIDEMIIAEQMENIFIDDLDSEETHGVRFMGKKPEDKNLRRMLLGIPEPPDKDAYEVV